MQWYYSSIFKNKSNKQKTNTSNPASTTTNIMSSSSSSSLIMIATLADTSINSTQKHHHDNLHYQNHQEQHQHQQRHFYALARSKGEGLWKRTLHVEVCGGGESSDGNQQAPSPPPSPLSPPQLPLNHPQAVPHHQSNCPNYPSINNVHTICNHLLTTHSHPQQQQPTIPCWSDDNEKKNDNRRGIMQQVSQPQIYLDRLLTTCCTIKQQQQHDDQACIIQQTNNEANDLKTTIKKKASLKFNSFNECWTSLQDCCPINIDNQPTINTTSNYHLLLSPLQFTQYYAIKCLDLKYKYERCWDRLFSILCILDSLPSNKKELTELVQLKLIKFNQDVHSPNDIINFLIDLLLNVGHVVISILNQEFKNSNTSTTCLVKITNELNNYFNDLIDVGDDFIVNYQPYVKLVINKIKQ